MFEDNIKYQEISIEPSLLGMQVNIKKFQYIGVADFSGEEINLEINFLNSVIGNKIFVSDFSLNNAEVNLNEQRDTNQTDQPEVFIDQLSIIDLKVGNTIFKELNLSNVILVTTPNKLSYADIKKTINLVNKFNVPIMGYIENNIFNQDKDTFSEKLSLNKLGKFNFSEKMLNFDLDNDIEDADLISKKIIAHV